MVSDRRGRSVRGGLTGYCAAHPKPPGTKRYFQGRPLDNIIFQPPVIARPRRSGLVSVQKSIRSYFFGEPIEPRKGDAPVGNSARQPKGNQSNLQQPPARITAPGYSIEELAARDDVVFAIRNALRRAIGEMKWAIVPDVDKIKADLKRWQTIVQLNMTHPGFDLKFVPQVIEPEFFWKALGELRNVTSDMQAEGETPSTSLRMREFFANCLTYHEAIAEGHVNRVMALFERPNPSAESSFRALLDTIIDSLTLYDSAALIKNPTTNGILAELYTVPGDGIRIYRCPDRSTPQPPEIAYDWYEDAVVKANFNNLELVYVRMNPASTGYGTSPILVILRKMVGSMYGDQYINEGFSNSNIPNFVFDLGPDVSQEERDMVETEWENKVSKGQRRGIFIGSKEGVKGFIPLTTGTNKDQMVLELLKYWANVKCAAYGLSLNDIGFTEDLHRTTSETQADLTQSRGVHSMATTIQSFLNSEVLKGRLWVRDDPMDTMSLAGHSEWCFPFRDVKFEFIKDEREEKLEDAQRAESLVGSGILTINEVRHELKLPPRPGGDVLTIAAQPGCKVEDLPQLPPPQAPQAPGAPGAGGGPPGLNGGHDGKPPDGKGETGVPAPKPPKPPNPKGPSEEGSNDNQAQKRLADLNATLIKMLAAPEES